MRKCQGHTSSTAHCGQVYKYTDTELQGKQPKHTDRNSASEDTTLLFTQAFSSLPYTYGKNEKLEIWRNFFWKKMEKMEISM